MRHREKAGEHPAWSMLKAVKARKAKAKAKVRKPARGGHRR